MEKFKTYKKTIIITSIVTILPILIGLILWNRLPNELATHFDMNNVADGWSTKPFVVFGLPFIVLGIHLLCTLATCMDPKNHKIGDKIFKVVLWLIPAISWFSSLTTYGYNLGITINTTTYAMVLLGVVFIVIGNYLPKCRQNYTIGIKIPWTLNDEDNWNSTHRFAGKIWMIGGVIFVLLAFAGLSNTWVMPTVMLTFIFIPVAYSFIYYIKHR